MELHTRQAQSPERRAPLARSDAPTSPSTARRRSRGLALAALLFSAAGLSAQEGGTSVVPLSIGISDGSAISSPFSLGNLGIQPHFTYRYMQADGLRAANGERRTTSIQDFAPGVMMRLGDIWSLSYQPTWRAYSESGFDDRVNHVAQLTGDTTYYDWNFHFDQHYSAVAQTIAETGRQTRYDYYGTSFSFGHPVNSKIAYEIEAHQDIRFTEAFSDYRQWSGTGWLDYLVGPGLKVGVGAGGGYVSVDGPDMTYVHGMGRVGVRVSRKVELDLRGGIEDRNFRGGDRPNLSNTVVDLGLTYDPFENTNIRIGASRDVGVSYFQGQVVERERISARLRQRLFSHFTLTLGVTNDSIDYISTVAAVDALRDDERRTYTVGVSLPPFRRIRGSLFYRASENKSSSTDLEYSSDQYGFEVSIQ